MNLPNFSSWRRAFHLVYQALETLSDPQARQNYDGRTAAQVHVKRARKKAAKTAGRPAAVKKGHGHD